jgi:transcriptional regulator with XRE-family HTH domain
MPQRERAREYPESLSPFGRLIYTHRNRLGMALHDVGTAAGFRSGDYLSLIERGKRTPDLDRVPRLAKVLLIEPKLLCEAWILQFHPHAAEALGIVGFSDGIARVRQETAYTRPGRRPNRPRKRQETLPPVPYFSFGHHPRCSGRNSHRSGFKVAHLVIFHGITDLDRLAAHFAVFHIGLSLDRGVEHHRNPLTAVWAYEEMLHCLKNKALRPPLGCITRRSWKWVVASSGRIVRDPENVRSEARPGVNSPSGA